MSGVVEAYAQHVNPAFVRLLGRLGYGRVFTRALDTRVWDDQGREYLDFLAGFGAVALGHNHPRLVAGLQRFLSSEALNLVHVGPSAPMARLAAALATLLPPLEVSLFASSGAEAVEAAMKVARLATGRRGFVSCEGGFHGTNLGTLSVMGSDRMRVPLEPLLEGCRRIPFGDLVALERALADRPAGFVVEPVQGEGGVVIPPSGYLAEARERCRRAGTLFIADEVQTGLGRTGTMLACQAEGVVPDVLVLGKALGGSIAPISVALVRRELYVKAFGSTERFDLHGSTFGGNSFACAAALETLGIIADEDLVARSAERGRQMLDGLRVRLAGHPLVREIRGRGLLVAVELGSASGAMRRLKNRLSREVVGQWLALCLLERGVLCQPASQCWNILRLEPPLTVQAQEVDLAVEAVGEVLDRYRSFVVCQVSNSGQLAGESPAKVRVRPPCSDHPASGAIRASKRCHRDQAVRNIK